MKYLCNFSGGASSVLATKIAIDFFGKDNCDIVFAETNQHLPFMKDIVEKSQDIYGKEINILNSGKRLYDLVIKYGHYENTKMCNFCTRILKQEPIMKFCKEHYPDGEYTDVLGYDYSAKELRRASKFILFKGRGCFPLIELRYDKIMVLAWLEKLGFGFLKEHYRHDTHNNCIPCIKAGKGHWNYVREFHSHIFSEWHSMEQMLAKQGKANCLHYFAGNKKAKEYETECNGFFCTVDDIGNLIKDEFAFLANYFHGIGTQEKAKCSI